jgi:hypothetical protein
MNNLKFQDWYDVEPEFEVWYLVKCPDYCESGYHMAKFQFNRCWVTDGGDTINAFVKGYAKLEILTPNP